MSDLEQSGACSLAAESCQVCRVGAPLVSEEDMAQLRPMIPEWQVLQVDGIERLQREFTFKNFKQAIAFTNMVGDLAEAAGHHPAILTEWGQVTIGWWTHKIKGLHRNDFILAARTDELQYPH